MDFYSKLYESSVAKNLCITAAVIFLLFTGIAISGIIVFHLRGSDKKRTIINHLIVSFCYSIIQGNLFWQWMIYFTLYSHISSILWWIYLLKSLINGSNCLPSGAKAVLYDTYFCSPFAALVKINIYIFNGNKVKKFAAYKSFA